MLHSVAGCLFTDVSSIKYFMRKFCFYNKTNEIHQFLKFILFCSSTLHVSDGLSLHHQESKTRYSIRYMYSLRLLMMDGKTVRNM